MMNTLKKPEELPDVAHYITVTFDELGFSKTICGEEIQK
jgi:hypothetical protein